MQINLNGQEHFYDYSRRLQEILQATDWSNVHQLAVALLKCWQHGRTVFLCGNGGSAGNAIHLANDFLYGVAKKTGAGLRVMALPGNPAVITCLANDVGYDYIFSEQLAVHAQPGDLLIALSGSGNSGNIVKAIEQAKMMGVTSYAVLGFDGGKCKQIADLTIHFPVYDMQIAEDLQIIVGHMLMQWLYSNRKNHNSK